MLASKPATDELLVGRLSDEREGSMVLDNSAVVAVKESVVEAFDGVVKNDCPVVRLQLPLH